MKRVIFLFSIYFTLASCGGGSGSSSEKEGASADSSATTSVSTAGGDLIAKSGCFTCHKEQEKLIGPAYADVAAKYSATDENINNLAKTVVKGSVGKWGEIPMPANVNVSEEDAKEMVRYILSLKKP